MLPNGTSNKCEDTDMAYILRGEKIGMALGKEMEEISGAKVIINGKDSLPSDDLVIRWGVTTIVPGNPKVINKIKSIEKSTDKRGFRLECAKNNLSPKSWGSFEDYLLESPQGLTSKLLVRPEFHAKSQDMILCTSLYELLKGTQKFSKYYISEFIDKKREFRVFIAQNRVVWMIEKFPKDKSELSWGCITTGEFEYVGWSEWQMDAVRVSLEAMKLSTLDFGAVDVIVDAEGKAYVMEINTAPFLTPYYMKCIGKVFKWMINKGREHFEDTSLSWKSVIHPAIADF